MHLQVEEVEDEQGKKSKKETMIFPRYHQLDVTRKLLKESPVNMGQGITTLFSTRQGLGSLTPSLGWLISCPLCTVSRAKLFLTRSLSLLTERYSMTNSKRPSRGLTMKQG